MKRVIHITRIFYISYICKFYIWGQSKNSIVFTLTPNILKRYFMACRYQSIKLRVKLSIPVYGPGR